MGTIAINSGKPQYKHDCDNCDFLGKYERDGNITDHNFDLYFCTQGDLPTVIARYGDEGSYYLSGLEIAKDKYKTDPNHPLVAAMMVARSMKLINIDLSTLK